MVLIFISIFGFVYGVKCGFSSSFGRSYYTHPAHVRTHAYMYTSDPCKNTGRIRTIFRFSFQSYTRTSIQWCDYQTVARVLPAFISTICKRMCVVNGQNVPPLCLNRLGVGGGKNGEFPKP